MADEKIAAVRNGASNVTDLDLTQDPHEQKSAASPPPPPPTEKKFDPEPAREKLRGVIALMLLVFLILLIIISFITMWVRGEHGKDISDLLELLKIFVSPLIALVSTVVGFYFGSITKQS